MTKRMIGVLMLAVALVVPAIAAAHEGHAHKVMGTVASIDGNQLTVTTVDGQTAVVKLDAKTKITQGKNKVDAKAVRVGDRVVAEGPKPADILSATTLKLGVATAAAKP